MEESCCYYLCDNNNLSKEEHMPKYCNIWLRQVTQQYNNNKNKTVLNNKNTTH